ncbi:MAG: hypothetical protein AAF533_09655 [Acidobacteriota bacterium]
MTRHVCVAILFFIFSCPVTSRALPAGAVLLGSGEGRISEGGPHLVRQDGEILSFVGDLAVTERGVPTYQFDLWWMDTTLDGTILAEGRLGGPDNEQLRAATATSDGGLVLGSDIPSDATGLDALLVKLDAAREVEWLRAYESGGVGSTFEIFERADGNLLVLGFHAPHSWLASVSPEDGSILQSVVLDAGEFHVADVAALDESGGLLIGGESRFEDNFDFWLVRLDSDLSLVWQFAYGGDGEEILNRVLRRECGGWLLVGWTSSFGPGVPDGADSWVVALDDDGNVDWEVAIDTELMEGAYQAIERPDGAFLVSGITSAMDASVTDIWLAGLEADGSPTWGFVLGGEAQEIEARLFQLDDGRALVTGQTASFSADLWGDAWLTWTGADGRLPDSCTVARPLDLTSMPTSAVRRETFATTRELAVTTHEPELGASSWSTARREQCWDDIVDPPRDTPSEVSGTDAEEPLRVTADGVLSWEEPLVSGSDTFTVYRGRLARLPSSASAACLVTNLRESTLTDPELPEPGEGWYYLVAGETASGEGSLGTESPGTARGWLTPCPCSP